MAHSSDLHGLTDAILRAPGTDPVAIIAAEDGVWLAETVAHHLGLGFTEVIVVCPPYLGPDCAALAATLGETGARLRRVAFDTRACPGGAAGAERALTEAALRARTGRWVYLGVNAEFLFFPFCETRKISDFTGFVTEERRDAVAGVIVDIFPAKMEDVPPDSPEARPLWFDALGYVEQPRRDPTAGWAERARESVIFGGLRRRFEGHIPHTRRSIARMPLFRALPDVALDPEGRFSIDEMNTRHCAWHRNPTVAVASLRAAKALRANPDSRAAISGLLWPGAQRFDWSSQTLLAAGLMEPGQWL
jgi:hypothetical protein